MNADHFQGSLETRGLMNAQDTGSDAHDGSSPEQRPAKLARKRMGGYWQNAQNSYEQASLQLASNNTAALTGRPLEQKSLINNEYSPQTLLRLKSSAESFKFSASHFGKLLAVRNMERIFVVDLEDKPHVKQTLATTSQADFVQISDDGSLLVVVDTNLIMEWWRLGQSVERVRSIKLEQAVSALALTSDNSLVAVAHQDSVELISLSLTDSDNRKRLIPAPAVEHLEFSRNGAVLLGTTLHAASALTLAIHLPGLHTTGSSGDTRPSFAQSWLAQPFYPNAFPQHCLASLLPARYGRSSAWAFSMKERRFLELDLQSFHWNSAAETGKASEAPSHLLPAVNASGELVAVAGDREVYVFTTGSGDTRHAALGSTKNFIRIPTPSDITSIFWIKDHRKSITQDQMSHRLVCTFSKNLLSTAVGLWQETDEYAVRFLDLAAPSSEQFKSSEDKKASTYRHDPPLRDPNTQLLHAEDQNDQASETHNVDTQSANAEDSMPLTISQWDLMSHLSHARETGTVTSLNGRPRVPRIILRDDTNSASGPANTIGQRDTIAASQIHHGAELKEDRQFAAFDPDDSPSKWSVDRRDGPLPVPVLRDQKFHYGTLPHVELDHDPAGHRSRQSLSRYASKSSDLMPKFINHEDEISKDRSSSPTPQERDATQTTAHQRHLQAARSALSLQSDDRDPSGVSSVHELAFREEQTRPGFPEMLAEDITRMQDGGNESQDFDQFSGAHQAEQVLPENVFNRSVGRTKVDSGAPGPQQISQQSSTSDMSDYGPERTITHNHASPVRMRDNPQTPVTEDELMKTLHVRQSLPTTDQALHTPESSFHNLPSAQDASQPVEEGASDKSKRSLRRVLSFNIAERDSRNVTNIVERETSDADIPYPLRPSGSFDSTTPIQAQRPHSKMILPLVDFPDLAANHARTDPYYSDTDQESSASHKFRVRRRPINSSSVYSVGSDVSDTMAAESQDPQELQRPAQPLELDTDIPTQPVEQRVTPPGTPLEDVYDYPTPPSTTQVDSLSRRLGSSTPATRILNNAAPKAALGAGRRIDNADALRSHPPDTSPVPPTQNDYRSYRSTFSHGTPLYTIPSMNSLKTLPKSDGRPSIEIADEPVPEIPQNYKDEAQITASAVARENGLSREGEPQIGKPSKKNKRRSWDLLKRVGGSKSTEALSQMSSEEESKRRKTSSLRSKDSGDGVKSMLAVTDTSDSTLRPQLSGTANGPTVPVEPTDTVRLTQQTSQRSRSSLRQRLSEDWADYRRGTPDSAAHSTERRQGGSSAAPSIVDHSEQALPPRGTSRLQKRRSQSSSHRGNSNVGSAVIDDATTSVEQETRRSRPSNLRQRVSDYLGSGRNSISEMNDVARGQEDRPYESTNTKRSRAPSFRQRMSTDWTTYTSAPGVDHQGVVADTRAMHCDGTVNNGVLSQAPERAQTPVVEIRPARKHRISGVWTRDRSTTPSTENLDRSSTNGESSSMTAPTTVTEGMTTADPTMYAERPSPPRSSSRLSNASTARRVSDNIAARNRIVTPRSGPFASQYTDARDSGESTRDEHGDWAMGRHMSSAGSRPQLASIKRLSGSFNDWARTRTARGTTFNHAVESSNAIQVDREEIMMSGGSGADYGAPTDLETATGGETTTRVVDTRPGLPSRASRARSRAGSIIRRLSGTDGSGGPRQKPSGASTGGSVFGAQRPGTRTSVDSVDEGADWAMARHFRTMSTTASRPASGPASRRTSGIFRGGSVTQTQQPTDQVPSTILAGNDGARDGVRRQVPARAPSAQGSVFGVQRPGTRTSVDSVDEGADWAMARHFRTMSTTASRPASGPASRRTSGIFRGGSATQQPTDQVPSSISAGNDGARDGVRRQVPARAPSAQGSVFGVQRPGTRMSEDSIDEGADWAMGRHFRTVSTTASRRSSGIFRGRSAIQTHQPTREIPSTISAGDDGARDGAGRQVPARAPSAQGSVFGRAPASARVSEDSVDEGADWAFGRHMRTARPASNNSRTSAIFGLRRSMFGRKTSHDLGNAENGNAESVGTRLNRNLRDDEAGTAGATAAAATAMEHYPDPRAAEHDTATAPITTRNSDRLYGSLRQDTAGSSSMQGEERPQKVTSSGRRRGRSSVRDGDRKCVIM